MSYSLDFRQKVLNYIENGGRVVKAAKVFGIARATIYRWLNRQDLEATKVERRKRKLDWRALEEDVKSNQSRKIDRESQKIWGPHNCHLVCTRQNEDYPEKKRTPVSRKKQRRKNKVF